MFRVWKVSNSLRAKRFYITAVEARTKKTVQNEKVLETRKFIDHRISTVTEKHKSTCWWGTVPLKQCENAVSDGNDVINSLKKDGFIVIDHKIEKSLLFINMDWSGKSQCSKCPSTTSFIIGFTAGIFSGMIITGF